MPKIKFLVQAIGSNASYQPDDEVEWPQEDGDRMVVAGIAVWVDSHRLLNQNVENTDSHHTSEFKIIDNSGKKKRK